MDLATTTAEGGVQYDRNRAAVLEALFDLDGRHSSDHPQHHCYTGLVQECRTRIGADQLDEITRRFHLIDGAGALRSALEAAPE